MRHTSSRRRWSRHHISPSTHRGHLSTLNFGVELRGTGLVPPKGKGDWGTLLQRPLPAFLRQHLFRPRARASPKAASRPILGDSCPADEDGKVIAPPLVGLVREQWHPKVFMVEDMKIRPHKMPVVLHDSDAADPLTASGVSKTARSRLAGRQRWPPRRPFTMGTFALGPRCY